MKGSSSFIAAVGIHQACKELQNLVDCQEPGKPLGFDECMHVFKALDKLHEEVDRSVTAPPHFQQTEHQH